MSSRFFPIRRQTIVSICFLSFLSGLQLQAGGPLLLDARDAFRWPASPISFIVDGGPLRNDAALISMEQGAQIVRESFQVWADVATAALSFEDRGFLDVDVHRDNFEDFLNAVRTEGNPIIFDADGMITDEIFGAGSSTSVLGFASSFDTNGDEFLDYGRAVLNGRRASISPTGAFRATVIHEIGHMLGLDHTQAGEEFFNRCGPAVADPCERIPVMFPIIIGNAAAFVTKPLRDDQAWISWLYPAENFRTTTGTIQGRVSRRSGVPFQGANVVAVPVTVTSENEIVESDRGLVSCVSDFLFRFDGTFELPGLEPGDYVVFIEPIDEDFTEGSRVGPFDIRYTDFPKDYFNGTGESGDAGDDPLVRQAIHVEAGQVLTDLRLISNDASDDVPGQDLSDLVDDDSRAFIFPAGFSFPFFGRTYQGIFVNSDGNLTFDGFDSSSSRRSQPRFLGGPPRIAPLFSDLNPEIQGQVRTEFDSTSLTFFWDSVPPFGGSAASTNLFSVRLFSNGNIQFRYESIAARPSEGVTAIVGISPGDSTTGRSVDLSALERPIPIETSPIFELFPTPASIDLQGAELFFQATANQVYLLFPFYRGNALDFTGIAVSNDAPVAANLEVEARQNDGTLQVYPDNPHLESLGSKEQLARLGSDFFNIPITTLQDGWIRIGSDQTELASFFQFGNGLTGTTTKLDGSVAFTEPAQTLYFTRLYHGPAGLPLPVGQPQDAQTILSVANPSEDAQVELTFRLFSADGQMIGNPVSRTLSALGCIRESLTQLFGAAGNVSNGFVRVDASGPGAVGFELVELADTLLGFNASFGNQATTLFSAQLANGNAGVSIFTSVKITNVGASQRSVTLAALRDDGTAIGTADPIVLQPNQSFQGDIQEIFGLGSPSGVSTSGSLRVTANGPGIIGDVVFGDPETFRYGAALPLQTELLRRAVFSQVANAAGASAAQSTFTGLAFHNPNAVAASIQIRVFSEAGVLTGERTVVLGPGQRLSDVLQTLIPSTAGQVRGYIEVTSDQPVVAQQLFGNFTLEFLSAVPPTVFQ